MADFIIQIEDTTYNFNKYDNVQVQLRTPYDYSIRLIKILYGNSKNNYYSIL